MSMVAQCDRCKGVCESPKHACLDYHRIEELPIDEEEKNQIMKDLLHLCASCRDDFDKFLQGLRTGPLV